MFFKNIQKILSPFLCKKTIKECPVPLDISIKSNRKHHKTVLYRKTNKNMFGRLFGRFFIVFGRFFNKNIWSPCQQIEITTVQNCLNDDIFKISESCRGYKLGNWAVRKNSAFISRKNRNHVFYHLEG
jgi:hypothetical protein